MKPRSSRRHFDQVEKWNQETQTGGSLLNLWKPLEHPKSCEEGDLKDWEVLHVSQDSLTCSRDIGTCTETTHAINLINPTIQNILFSYVDLAISRSRPRRLP